MDKIEFSLVESIL